MTQGAAPPRGKSCRNAAKRLKGGGPLDLLPFRISELVDAVWPTVYGIGRRVQNSICSPLQSICEAYVCAAGAQTIEFELRIWRRRPI